jgi:hypothetical protein
MAKNSMIMSNYSSIGIVKVAKRHTFTPIDNSVLRDKELTNEALGLLCRSLANVEDWHTNIKGAMSMSCDTKGGVTRQIHHLQKCGYAHLIVEKDANTKSVLRKYYRIYEEKQNIEISPVIEFITANNEKITAKKRQTDAERLMQEIGATDEKEFIELLRAAKAIRANFNVSSDNDTMTVQPKAAQVQTVVTPPHVEIDFFAELTQDTEFLETMKTKYSVENDEITALIDCFKGNNSAKKHLVYSDFQKHFGNWIPNGLKILATKNRPKKQAGTGRTNTPSVSKKEIIQEVGRYKAMMEAANEHTKYSEYKETVKNLIDWTEKAVKYMNNEQITRFEELKTDYNTAGALKKRLEKQIQDKANTPLSTKTENLLTNLSQTLNVR